MDRLKGTMRVADADVAGYDAIYLTGGHGVMWDLATSAALADLVSATWARGGTVAAVCHGPAGLLEVKVGGSTSSTART